MTMQFISPRNCGCDLSANSKGKTVPVVTFKNIIPLWRVHLDNSLIRVIKFCAPKLFCFMIWGGREIGVFWLSCYFPPFVLCKYMYFGHSLCNLLMESPRTPENVM